MSVTLNIFFDPKKLNLSLDAQEDFVKDPRGCYNTFENVLTSAVHSWGQIGGPKQRCMSRILEKLDESTDGNLVLEQAELDLLKEIFLSEKTTINPLLVRVFGLFQRKIEELALSSG